MVAEILVVETLVEVGSLGPMVVVQLVDAATAQVELEGVRQDDQKTLTTQQTCVVK